ncbi:hypothetical protein EJ110_NYTH14148 [Nymphaea thermarum]|nr:hypothetical protein EJ110_NYTH14148 [Nymphaea thermarum]
METFEWLFKAFIKAMNSKHPMVVLIDDDNAIVAAMSHMWPEARTNIRAFPTIFKDILGFDLKQCRSHSLNVSLFSH